MKINATITMCEVIEGVSKTTGNPWKKANYIATYPGQWSNGTACTRTIYFEVFGERLSALKIYKGQTGVLEFETKAESHTSSKGTAYYTNTIDILSWAPAKSNEETKAAPVQAAQVNASEPKEITPSSGAADNLPF